MSNNLFINCTQHTLTPEQQEAAQEELKCSEIIQLRDLNPELYNKLANTPMEKGVLASLAIDLLDLIIQVAEENSNREVYIHFPIGSPAFQYVFTIIFHTLNIPTNLHLVFSHSNRIANEIQLPDGSVKKEFIFKFQGFIKF